MGYVLLMILVGTLIVFYSAATHIEANEISNSDVGTRNTLVSTNSSNKDDGLKSVIDSNKVDQVEGDKGEVDNLKGVQNDKLDVSHSNEQLESKKVHNVAEGRDGSMGEGNEKEGHKKEKSNKGSEGADVKDKSDKGVDMEVSASLPPVRKQSSQSEECDPSNRCTDKKNVLVACLRVPGSESSDLSLLIQNKGKGSLSINISAPNFVWLEKTTVQLQEKGNTKVKVSIANSGNGNVIILSAGNGDCSLDFRDLIAQYLGKEMVTSKFMQINFFRRNPITALLFVIALLVVASACTYVSFQRRHFITSIGSKYQRLDEGLPVSDGGKLEPESNDRWESGWGDSWDDEEAPKTPSMPVTPVLSSKGLASRRLNKEGWKD